MSEKFAQGICWNLNDLYNSIQDPRIEQDLKIVEEKALQFEAKYKPLLLAIKGNPEFPLFDLLEDYKKLVDLTTRLGVFSHLSFAEKTNAPGVGAFMQKIQVKLTDVYSHLLFFDVMWNQLEEPLAKKLMNDPKVAYAKHYLEHMRIFAPHTLSEPEEKIMSAKANTSNRAFSRLFDEVINNIPFYVEENGVRKKKSEAEVLALQYSSDRNQRKMSSASLAEGLAQNTHVLNYIYNMILADHRTSMQIRSYNNPMDSMNLSNEIDLNSVMGLMKSVKSAYPIAQRFYEFKRRQLRLEKIFEYDRYAPIGAEESKVTFDQCKEIVLSGYYAFSSQVGNIVEQFFDKRWIDAEVREGKQGGGFCCQTTPDLHPYILVNYTGSMRDVMTVAHELGHGLHQYLAAKKVGILESDAPLTMAETASVFGEMLIFEKILEAETNPQNRLALICGKIDDNFATVYRQIAMTDFELKAHTAGMESGELSSEQLSDFWMEANRDFYGKSVELTDNYRHGWKYIPHFVHSPFYCYAYAFAQLFVLSLFQKYKEDKASFVPKYLEMLSLGGSRRPEDIAKIAGLDISKPDFWQSGLSILDELVKQAEKS